MKMSLKQSARGSGRARAAAGSAKEGKCDASSDQRAMQHAILAFGEVQVVSVRNSQKRPLRGKVDSYANVLGRSKLCSTA
jgi:hypothetical protein